MLTVKPLKENGHPLLIICVDWRKHDTILNVHALKNSKQWLFYAYSQEDPPGNLAAWENWLVDSHENFWDCCHQMSDFKAKMHWIWFRLGLCPGPRWGSLQHSTDPLAAFKEPTAKERRGRCRRGRGETGKGGEGKGWEVPSALLIFPRCRGARIATDSKTQKRTQSSSNVGCGIPSRK